MKYKKNTPVENLSVCRNCGRCMECCPAEIPIPDMLQIYQQYHAIGTAVLDELKAKTFLAHPIDCIECGACSNLCPAHLDPAGVIHKLAMASCQ